MTPDMAGGRVTADRLGTALGLVTAADAVQHGALTSEEFLAQVIAASDAYRGTDDALVHLALVAALLVQCSGTRSGTLLTAAGAAIAQYGSGASGAPPPPEAS